MLYKLNGDLCLCFCNFSRAAVVRGQVVTSSGMGLIGVRVSTTLPNEGFTMTRDDGWFDLMVNGGGPVMLQFGRNPYPPLRYLVLDIDFKHSFPNINITIEFIYCI